MTLVPIDALRALREELWDAERGMDRFARGVVPGVDISSLNLHAVRETALGAFLDLENGNASRAIIAIRSVLATQYPTSDWPWSGTFPVTAEQDDPPGDDAIEWVHYDPNWRQFLGCILALTVLEHGDALPDDVAVGIAAALVRCVEGEPDGRIAPWYTNPNLMHAWLQCHVGNAIGDDEMRGHGLARVEAIAARFERFGDVDEYNSPTYDGIDLFALALWVQHPPNPRYHEVGAAMIARLGERISTLYHPALGATCGPYIRAYGLELRRYVSLVGIWLHVLGEPDAAVLPNSLDQDSVHVHDLYFLAVIRRLAPAVRPHLTIAAVTTERGYAQRFGDAVAESLVRPDIAVGWEFGRRQDFSIDQYVPFSAHFEVDGQPTSFGVMVPDETAWVDCRRVGDLEFEIRAAGRDDRVGLRIVTGMPATIATDRLTLGHLELRCDERADHITEEATPIGSEIHLTWNSNSARLTIVIG